MIVQIRFWEAGTGEMLVPVSAVNPNGKQLVREEGASSLVDKQLGYKWYDTQLGVGSTPHSHRSVLDVDFGRPVVCFIYFCFLSRNLCVSIQVVGKYQFVTANDCPARDPSTWQVWGINDLYTSHHESAQFDLKLLDHQTIDEA